jgi:RHH-type proline utilization regulon transcriptional repressor/proline dehydrogenase/delta 1-pyrroline-5-carboxylate dehydrogenase
MRRSAATATCWPYLVRRLLENGANSSFVAAAADPSVPIEDILKRPQAWIGDAAHARHPHIPLPRDLYRPARMNSSGVEFGDRVALNALMDEVQTRGSERRARRYRRSDPVQRWRGCGGLPRVERNAGRAPRRGSRTRRRTAGGVARNTDRLDAIRRRQDLDDASSELREAVDYCRYYAAEARRALVPATMPGPTGRVERIALSRRGVFVCISPWNFPLAIFLGQVDRGARRRSMPWWQSPPSRHR